MCNLYSITRSQDAMRQLFAIEEDLTGNLPPLPAVFPDMLAPIVRTADGGRRRLETMRWGLPGPSALGGAPVTNVRKATSPHWRAWLGPDHRCLVPATSFCEWAAQTPKVPTWFARDATRPLFAFAGIWTAWHGVRGPKSAPIDGEHRLFTARPMLDKRSRFSGDAKRRRSSGSACAHWASKTVRRQPSGPRRFCPFVPSELGCMSFTVEEHRRFIRFGT